MKRYVVKLDDEIITGAEACIFLRLTPIAFDKLYWASDEVNCESDAGAGNKAWAMTFKVSALQRAEPHLLDQCREANVASVVSRVQDLLELNGFRLSFDAATAVTRRFWDDAVWMAAGHGSDPAEVVVEALLDAVAMPSFEYTADEEAASRL